MQTPKGRKLTKRERRIRRQQGAEDGSINTNDRFNFTLKAVSPLTENQHNTFDSYRSGKHLLLIGSPGTGKTFAAIYLGMHDIMEQELYDKMIIVRSIVSSRDIGFLPGTAKDKSKVYEAPYYSIFAELFGRGDAYEYLKNKGVVEFMNTSFVRGITLDNAVVIVDEVQNLSWQEVSSIFSRMGKNTKILFVGDTKQNDLHSKRDSEATGVYNLIRVIDNMKEFDTIKFTSDDIVRSGLVKSFIKTCERLGL
jgi:phosphate starvation-inducible protein PhoH